MPIAIAQSNNNKEKHSQKPSTIHVNLKNTHIIAHSIKNKEGIAGIGRSLMVTTGTHTGRSPKDKFFVKTDSVADTIWWDNNASMTPEAFATLREDMTAHMDERDIYTQDLYACADPKHRLNIRVLTELAWHSLFIRHLLRVPEDNELEGFTPDFTIINCPSFKADPARHGCRTETVIAINLDERIVLIGGTQYAGEIKKSVFTILNYLLPDRNIMPMHCSANHEIGNPENSAVFFGLSGTGKTTLSADSTRILIGDDEHGWGDDGVFNFEGGCYAKTIGLNPTAEPEIYNTTRMAETIIENMVYDQQTLEPDFNDDSITANMRCAYSLDAIPNVSETSRGGHPKHIIMLTCDAFGVLPPIARLTPEQAVYHFLSGFTAKVAGTECGVTEPEPAFSTCFGAPFMPRRPEIYGQLLKDKIERHGTQCWLVNTGWTGGGFCDGHRMPIAATRTILHAALNGDLKNTEYYQDTNFGFAVPMHIDGVDDTLLRPRDTWSDGATYDAQAQKLRAMFIDNFKQFEGRIDGVEVLRD